MYIKTIRKVVDSSIATYAEMTDQSLPDVRNQIKEHIEHTAAEHRTSMPDIDYEDSLCRIGYLYRHGAANASLFETVLLQSGALAGDFLGTSPRTLNVCAGGGGPGTELLGLAKYLIRDPDDMPHEIDFTVLDNISEWADTWDPLADEVKDYVKTHFAVDGIKPPVIAPAFLTFDVLDPSSYQNYQHRFKKADIVVFNYLFSENKTKFEQAQLALERLVTLTPTECTFIVIDRKENNPAFQENVVNLFESMLGSEITVNTFNGTIDSDERAQDMGEELLTSLDYPRLNSSRINCESRQSFGLLPNRKVPEAKDDHIREL